MEKNLQRGEIIVSGLVQGVGYRYFVQRNAMKLGLNGFTRNLCSGEVLTVIEGEKFLIEDLFNILKVGPPHAEVRYAAIKWSEYKNEFKTFEITF
jgi:acylphosphatase